MPFEIDAKMITKPVYSDGGDCDRLVEVSNRM